MAFALALLLSNAHGFSTMSRRVAIRNGAAALLASTLPPHATLAAKPASVEEQTAFDRAEIGSGFETDRVIRGAVRQDLVDIQSISSCAKLDELQRIDQKADLELRQAIRELSTLERASESLALRGADESALKEASAFAAALKDAKVVQTRIVERIAALESAQFERQCIGGAL